MSETEREMFLRQAEFLRRQRHDYLNGLQVIRGYIQLGKPERAFAYIEEASAAFAPQQEISRIAEERLQALTLYLYLDLKARGLVVSVRVAEEFRCSPPALGDSERASAFCAFVHACGAEVEGGVFACGENHGSATIELVSGSKGFVCRFSLYQKGELLKERSFLASDE
jgi:hypothetical protein